MFQRVAGALFFHPHNSDRILSAHVKNQNYEILNNKRIEMLQLCLFGFSVQQTEVCTAEVSDACRFKARPHQGRWQIW